MEKIVKYQSNYFEKCELDLEKGNYNNIIYINCNFALYSR